MADPAPRFELYKDASTRRAPLAFDRANYGDILGPMRATPQRLGQKRNSRPQAARASSTRRREVAASLAGLREGVGIATDPPRGCTYRTGGVPMVGWICGRRPSCTTHRTAKPDWTWSIDGSNGRYSFARTRSDDYFPRSKR